MTNKEHNEIHKDTLWAMDTMRQFLNVHDQDLSDQQMQSIDYAISQQRVLVQQEEKDKDRALDSFHFPVAQDAVEGG